jgi:hypothetical protein
LLAEKIRIRDGRVCVRCGKTEKEQGFKMSVDHIIPLRLVLSWNEAGLTDVSPNNEANLMSLCKNCHGIKTAAEIRYLRGDAVGFWRELGGHEGIAVAMRLYGERPPGEARSTNPTADLLFKELREENQWRN